MVDPVPGNPWLHLCEEDAKNLLSSAPERVQNVLRHCMQTKPDRMLLRSKLSCWSGKFSHQTAVMFWPSLKPDMLKTSQNSTAKMNETTKKVRRVLDQCEVEYDLNVDTAVGDEAAEVPVKDKECQPS